LVDGLEEDPVGSRLESQLELARDRSAGALTYHVNVTHTAQTREILGPDAFLGVEHAVLFESGPDKARAIAREHLHPYLNTKYNLAKFRRLGYSEEEITNGGSDRLVDDLVFWGDLDTIVEKLHAHVEAGADHVGVQVIGIEPGQSAMPVISAAAAQRLIGLETLGRCSSSRARRRQVVSRVGWIVAVSPCRPGPVVAS
jgi:probable F420-dependent oxidoreductase